MSQQLLLRALIALPFLGALVGCSSEPAATPPAPAASASDQAKEIEEAMAALSPEDRALAMAQAKCPVSGGALGGMGAPIAVEVKGRKVFVCCEACRQPVLDDPDKYLAQLPAAADVVPLGK